MSDEGRAGRRTWRDVLLVVSVCLNCLLLGLVGMGAARFFWPGPDRVQAKPSGANHGFYFGIGQGVFNPDMMGRIAVDKADTIRGVVSSHRSQLMALHRDSVAARGDALNIFTSDNFDKTAFERALARIQTSDAAFETETMRVIAASAAVLTTDERKAVAERWRRGRGHGWGMGGGGGGGGEGPHHFRGNAPPP
jgi:uncharacterized membrane protein